MKTLNVFYIKNKKKHQNRLILILLKELIKNHLKKKSKYIINENFGTQKAIRKVFESKTLFSLFVENSLE